MDIDNLKAKAKKIGKVLCLQILGGVIIYIVASITVFVYKGFQISDQFNWTGALILALVYVVIVIVLFNAFRNYLRVKKDIDNTSSTNIKNTADWFEIIMLLIPFVGLIIRNRSFGLALLQQIVRQKEIEELFARAESTATYNFAIATRLLKQLVEKYPGSGISEIDRNSKISAVTDLMLVNLKSNVVAAMVACLEKAMMINYTENPEATLQTLVKYDLPQGFKDFMDIRSSGDEFRLLEDMLKLKKTNAEGLVEQYEWLWNMNELARVKPLQAVKALEQKYL